MWLRFGVTVLFILAIAAAVWDIVPWFEIQRWAVGEQRTFQNVMAGALRGIQAGNPQAVWTLCSATAAYGFFHALGPGHGKVLIGGASLASGATLKRLSILTFLSSLAQAATAIFLVGGLYFILQIGSADLTDLTETWLAPASYVSHCRNWSCVNISWRTLLVSNQPCQAGHTRLLWSLAWPKLQ